MIHANTRTATVRACVQLCASIKGLTSRILDDAIRSTFKKTDTTRKAPISAVRQQSRRFLLADHRSPSAFSDHLERERLPFLRIRKKIVAKVRL